jgi:hypothetical protein
MSEIEVEKSFKIIRMVYNNISQSTFLQLFQNDNNWKIWLNCNYNIIIFLESLNNIDREKFLTWVCKDIKIEEKLINIKKGCYVLELILNKFNIHSIFSGCNNDIVNHLENMWRNNPNIAFFVSVLGDELYNTLLQWVIKNINIEDVYILYKNNKTPVFYTDHVVDPKKDVKRGKVIAGYGIRNISKRNNIDESNILPKGVRNFSQLAQILGQN